MTNWADFPYRTLPADTTFSRIHLHCHSANHFGTSGDYRFDPPQNVSNKYGVCYLGREELAAYIEVFGQHYRGVPSDYILERRLSTARASRDLRVADLTERRVLGHYGVTAAHSTSSNYGPSQQLGASLQAAGFDGIYYRISHDPAMLLEAVAIFSPPHGNCPSSTALNWSKGSNIPQDLITQADQEFGIQVLPQP